MRKTKMTLVHVLSWFFVHFFARFLSFKMKNIRLFFDSILACFWCFIQCVFFPDKELSMERSKIRLSTLWAQSLNNNSNIIDVEYERCSKLSSTDKPVQSLAFVFHILHINAFLTASKLNRKRLIVYRLLAMKKEPNQESISNYLSHRHNQSSMMQLEHECTGEMKRLA